MGGEEGKERGKRGRVGRRRWKRMQDKIRSTLKDSRREGSRGKEKAGGTRKCEEAKREFRKELRRWNRRERAEIQKIKGKVHYNMLCDLKKKEENEKWEKKQEKREGRVRFGK